MGYTVVGAIGSAAAEYGRYLLFVPAANTTALWRGGAFGGTFSAFIGRGVSTLIVAAGFEQGLRGTVVSLPESLRDGSHEPANLLKGDPVFF